MTAIVNCALALVAGEEQENFSFAIDGDRIAAVAGLDDLRKRFPSAEMRTYGDDVAVIPGLVNGHSHGYQILLRGRGDDLPFARWREEALYKIIPGLTPDDVHRIYLQVFAEMLGGGVTTVAEFFYLNGAGNAHAEAAIAAARESGIRLILARCWMDAPAAPPAFRESIETATARTRDLMERFPDANVCVAPHSVHGASPEMIGAAAAFAQKNDCRLHMHLAEGQYELEQTKSRHGKTPLGLAASVGALNERLVAIHAIHLDGEEKKTLAASGASVIHNPVTNEYLGDGICDVTGFRELGVDVGLGTDANMNASIFDEMRAAALLQKLTHRDAGAFDAGAAFSLGTSAGAAALGVDAGDLRAGSFADYVVVSREAIDAWSPLRNAIVYRAQPSWVRETYAGGARRFVNARYK